MATIPKKVTLSQNAPDIVNAVRSAASPEYQAAVPLADESLVSLRGIGTIITGNQSLKNEFLNVLWNRIAKVVITSKLYQNPIRFMKKGVLEMGEVIEEIFIELAKPFEFDQLEAETGVFKRVIPDVKSKFHAMNYRKFYKQTISDKELKTAFLSWNGVSNLIAKIVDGMYSSSNYDEFLAMKYLLAMNIINGNIASMAIGNTTTNQETRSAVSKIKGLSNLLEFESSEYNEAGVHNFTLKDDQFILINAEFEALIDVEVLAVSFNMNKAEFMGHLVIVDSFGALDIPRLNDLFKEDPSYVEPSQDDLDELNNIPAVIIDRDYFMIYDNLLQFTEIYNAQGLYWNYFLHTWKTLSVSPFVNAVRLTYEADAITGSSITPAESNINVGQTVQLKATVNGTGFPSQKVTWSVGDDSATITQDGLVTAVSVSSSDGTIITATPVADPTKSSTAVVHITEA